VIAISDFTTTSSDTPPPYDDAWLEVQIYNGYRVWHIIFFIMTIFFTLGKHFIIKYKIKIIYLTNNFIVVFMCCCVRFRIPRTKQEIEADFIRRKIATKFCKQLRLLSDTEMDNMDLLKGINYN